MKHWIDLNHANENETYLWVFFEKDGKPFQELAWPDFYEGDIADLTELTEEQYDHLFAIVHDGEDVLPEVLKMFPNHETPFK